MTTTSTKRRKLTHTSPPDSSALSDPKAKTAQKSFFKNASSWNLEQDYETRPRKGKKKEKESTRLPTRTLDGGFEKVDDEAASVESDTEWLNGREDDSDLVEQDSKEEEAEQTKVSEARLIIEAKEQLAKIATSVNENPEEHAGAFKTLAKIGQSHIVTIQMLALITQMTVYKDIIPGYRIRPATEDGPKEKLSKEVRTVRQYEQALVAGYQGYIRELTRCAKLRLKPPAGSQSLSSIALSCACTLVTAVPHFNFLGDLLKILVHKLSSRRIDAEAQRCLEALETLFREDEDGRPSMEAVAILTKMMKARDYKIDERLVNLFLCLRLLSEFVGQASNESVEIGNGDTTRLKKKNREFRTKKDRKAKKEQKALEKDMHNADALVNREEIDRAQSETLKLVFATYFRILKTRIPHLMGAVLEGLAKYAHLINQDFFGDLLEALKDLILYSDDDENADDNGEGEPEDGMDGQVEEEDDQAPVRNLTREALLCTVTAFALLSGQDAHNSRNQLHLDLSFFITHLYRSLLPHSTNPELENTRLRMSGAVAAASKINVHTTTVLLLRSLTGVLLPAYHVRSVPPLRIAAFAKQLMITSLQVPEKSCQGMLALLLDLTHTHGRKVSSLWNTEERKGDGQYNAISETVEGSNPFAATVWEGELLRKHFSPKVREGAKLLEKSIASS